MNNNPKKFVWQSAHNQTAKIQKFLPTKSSKHSIKII